LPDENIFLNWTIYPSYVVVESLTGTK